MESFSTHPRQQHRGGHDGNHPPAGRRGTFKNRTWVSGERSGSNNPFQAGNHLGADAMRWERGGGRGRGRGKGRSPKPDFGPSQPHTAGEFSEVEEGGAEVEVAAAAAPTMDDTEPGPSDEPILDTAEERDRYYQEVSSRFCNFIRVRPAKERKHPA